MLIAAIGCRDEEADLRAIRKHPSEHHPLRTDGWRGGGRENGGDEERHAHGGAFYVNRVETGIQPPMPTSASADLRIPPAIA